MRIVLLRYSRVRRFRALAESRSRLCTESHGTSPTLARRAEAAEGQNFLGLCMGQQKHAKDLGVGKAKKKKLSGRALLADEPTTGLVL